MKNQFNFQKELEQGPTGSTLVEKDNKKATPTKDKKETPVKDDGDKRKIPNQDFIRWCYN